MMISCSSAVWECHGTTHPGDAFKTHVEGPAFGSPVSIADDRHFTSLSGENCTVPRGFTVPVAEPSARLAPLAKTAMHAIRDRPIFSFISPQLDVRPAHHAAPLVHLGHHEGAEFLRRVGARF